MSSSSRIRPRKDNDDQFMRQAPEKKRRLSASDPLNTPPDNNINDSIDQSTVGVTPGSAQTADAKRVKREPRWLKKKKQQQLAPDPCSPDDVVLQDIISLLGKSVVEKILEDGTEWDAPFEFRDDVELEVSMLSSNGEALAIAPLPRAPWAVLIPFALPGERIRARIYRNARLHSLADLISVESPNTELRDTNRVQCKYFGTCAGCQYQMLSYETQLDLKRNVVVKAYRQFSGLSETSIPMISQTIPSPLQYGYRTKITPHFEAPPKKYQKEIAVKSNDDPPTKPDWLKIGFNQIGKRQAMDIEECPIATPVLNEALRPMRENIVKNIRTYKKGVSLLLRDSLEIPREDQPSDIDSLSSSFEKHVAVTDHRAVVRERVGDMLFEYPGGSFFQNNNSVLVPLTSYVRDAIFSSTPADADALLPTHLVDAYCGAGLFSIILSPYFEKVAGIELAADSIRFATANAVLNNLPPEKCTFRVGDAADIFASVGKDEFPRDRTVLIIDPPRKGCDEKFIEQMLMFRCKMVVYVSCNVHTQARDVGMILRKSQEGDRGQYALESLRGFDLFPQTAHVESVAVLRLVS